MSAMLTAFDLGHGPASRCEPCFQRRPSGSCPPRSALPCYCGALNRHTTRTPRTFKETT